MYILTKNHRVLYTGVTNDLERRVGEHIAGLVKGFTSRYKVNRLLWFQRLVAIPEGRTSQLGQSALGRSRSGLVSKRGSERFFAALRMTIFLV